MDLKNYIDFRGNAGYGGLFFACGSFGIVDGNCNYTYEQKGEDKIYRYANEKIALVSVFTEKKNGVVLRKDFLENLSNEPQEINGFLSRFCLDGNAYDVYTQYNAWQHESSGGWQRLITQVTAASQGIRTCDSAAPIMALHNLYTGKNTVFHLLPNAQWKMTAKKFACNDKEIVVVETGFYSDGLRLQMAAGEKIELPTVILFSAESKVDLDAYKLHEVYNDLYPRRNLPVIYNSWLYCFDNLDVDALLNQVDFAAELGFEAFMIDAGWFGNGEDWSGAVGDWEENTVSGPKGRLIEISRRVREREMIFGLWFEPERANPESKAVKEHPDFYINKKLLDFSNPKAVDYITNVISKQIEKYDIGWLKFDFNDSIPLDPSGNAFYRYLQGQKRFIEGLRQRFPDLYLTNCASGGYRMELYQGSMFDSFWLSDNQGPYKGLDIVKNTLKRMPTALIERWNVQKYSDGFLEYGNKEKIGRMLSCNNATFDFIISVKDSFAKGFLTGGPMGWSCDLDVPAKYKVLWKEWISTHKKNREFYKTATARILTDTEEITVLEYADPLLERCIIQVFTKTTYARNLVIYPWVKKDVHYRIGDDNFFGEELIENGIFIDNLKENDCRIIELIKK